MSNAPLIVYTPKYDLHFMGLEKMHPFDGRKYSHAWNLLQEKHGQILQDITIEPDRLANSDELLRVHSQEYLDKVNSSKETVVQALELPILMALPMTIITWRIVEPMLLGTRGSIMAAELALENNLAVNFAGGYHHASRDNGEGFCLISDIAITIEHLREKGVVSGHSPAIIIDLDAHQGNGYERIFQNKDYVYIFDMYNQSIYPQDIYAKERIDYDVPLPIGIRTEEYLELLKHHLPMAFVKVENPSIVVYVAGTDIYSRDMLGGLHVSPEGIYERDKFVLNTCRGKSIPCVMLPAGGYSSESYKMLAKTVDYIITELLP